MGFERSIVLGDDPFERDIPLVGIPVVVGRRERLASGEQELEMPAFGILRRRNDTPLLVSQLAVDAPLVIPLDAVETLSVPSVSWVPVSVLTSLSSLRH